VDIALRAGGSPAPVPPESGEALSQAGASQAGAPDGPPPASLVRATHPHPKRPGAARSRFALVNWRVRWRLAAVIAVPTLTAAVLGALTINNDVNQWQATGRVQHLAQLNADVVKFSQSLEDELNASAAFAATRGSSSAFTDRLKTAQNATDSAANAVLNDSTGITTGAGYQPGTVQDLNAVRASINDLANVRTGVTKSQFPASQIVRVYSGNLITPANTFSGAIGTGANDADLQGNVATLGALLRNENQVAMQRAIRTARSSRPRDARSETHHPPAGPRAGSRRLPTSRLDRQWRAGVLQPHWQLGPGGRGGLGRDPGRADGHHRAERPAPLPAEAGELGRGHAAHPRGHPDGDQPAGRPHRHPG
jgi:hypothetical protein